MPLPGAVPVAKRAAFRGSLPQPATLPALLARYIYLDNGTLHNLPTTSRATVSPMYADASGDLVQYAANNVALVNGDSVACWPGVTNLLSRSEEFDDAAWTKVNVAINANVETAPDGTTTADRVNVTTSANNHDLYRSATITAGEIHTVSIFMKDDGAGYGYLSVLFNTSNAYTVVIDLSDGTVVDTNTIGGVANTSNSVEAIGNGWYRVSASGSIASLTSVLSLFGAINTDTPSYSAGRPTWTPSDGEDILIWGAQLTESSYPLPYVPTAGSSVALDASEPKYAEVSGLTNNLAGRLYWTPLADDQGTVWILGNYTDANNGWGILHDGTNLIFRNRVSGTNNDATIALNYVVDTEYRIDYRLAENGLDIAVDGTKGTTDSTTTDLTNATNSYYGQDGNDSGHCLCTIREHTEKKIASNFSDAEWLA